jgi:hypothetical protein
MKEFCGCITGSYSLLALVCLVIELWCFYSHTIAFNAWNCFMFVWMPIVVIFCLLVALLPILVILAVVKILF